jgi:hypothetical protein
MSDHENAPPVAPQYILTAAEIEAIEQEVARERRARRRKVPTWNSDTDSPWRSLEVCFVAALKTCSEIRTREFETVLARGKVWITGTRGDGIGDFLPDRIEGLVATAERLWFRVDSNSEIWATYSRPSGGAPLRIGALSIEFRNVRVHWPMLVEALREAGFDISLAPEKAETSQRPRGTAQNPLRPAPEAEIDEAIREVYNEAVDAKKKPPNIIEIVRPVMDRLRDAGFSASGRQIQSIADQHKHRRRKTGVTVASEKRISR